jgi:class 3 adenylate cyclase
LAALLGLAIYNLNLIADYHKSPDVFAVVAAIRIFCVTPFMLGLIALTRTKFGNLYLRSINLVSATIITASVLLIHHFTTLERFPSQPVNYMMALMFCLCTLRLLRQDAVIYSIQACGLYAVFLAYRDVPGDVFIDNLAALGLALAIGLVTAFATHSYIIHGYEDHLALLREKNKSEQLLHKMLPKEIAAKIQSGNNDTIAERADCVTVLFADLAGFTEASTKTPPELLVKRLNDILFELDGMTERHGCEKIKNIGDAYLAVCGAPQSAPDHADRIINLAREMLARAENLAINEIRLGVRIGVHSGPVVAGVIGRSRFTYDIWGDTVNAASRLETTAEINTIHISDATVKLLNTRPHLEKNAPVSLKGIGAMETWTIRHAPATKQAV